MAAQAVELVRARAFEVELLTSASPVSARVAAAFAFLAFAFLAFAFLASACVAAASVSLAFQAFATVPEGVPVEPAAYSKNPLRARRATAQKY
jgi:hypothetical protein